MALSDYQERIAEGQRLYDSERPAEGAAVLSLIDLNDADRQTPEYGSFCCLLGSCLAESGQLEQALEYFQFAEQYHEAREEWDALGLICFNTGNVFRYSGRVDESLAKYERAVELYRKTGHDRMVMMIQVSIGTLLVRSGQHEAARERLQEVEAQRESLGWSNDAIDWSRHLLAGDIAEAEGNDAAALRSRISCVEAARACGNAGYATESLLLLGKLQARLRDVKQARANLLEAQDWITRSESTSMNQFQSQITTALLDLELMHFGAPERSGDKSEVVAQDTHTPPELLVSESPQQPADLIMISADRNARENELSKLARLAEANATGLVCVAHDDTMSVFSVAEPDGIRLFVVEDAETWGQLEEGWTNQAVAHGGLLAVARQLCGAGIAAKAGGQLRNAMLNYLFALRIAMRYRDWSGLRAITGNVFLFARQLGQWAERDLRAKGGFENSDGEDDDAVAETTRETIRDEMSKLFPKFAELEQHSSALSASDRLQFMMAFRRCLVLSATSENSSHNVKSIRERLIGHIIPAALELGQLSNAFEVIYEEFADVTFLELFRLLGRTVDQEGTHFERVWRAYLRCRPSLGEAAGKGLTPTATLAVMHLQSLRVQVVSAGAATGHRWSYDLSQFLSLLTRDLIELFLLDGREQEALAMAEVNSSRALVDWMGRTHLNNRMVMRRGMTGSVGEVAPAELPELAFAAREEQAVILFYTALRQRYVLWAVLPSGNYLYVPLEDINDVLGDCFRSLPYVDSPMGFTRGVRDLNASPESSAEHELPEPLLRELGIKLIPGEIRELIESSLVQRIVLIPDQLINFVPFACLFWDADTYFLDKFDLLYFPSVTAWFLCQSELKARERIPDPLPSLVLGNPDCSRPRNVRSRQSEWELFFDELPGTMEEARIVADLLGVTPLLRERATLSSILAQYGGTTKAEAGIAARRRFAPVLHLATHGVFDAEDPEQSFVLLSDDVLTAKWLYEFDPGIRVGLVMLSCCQTGIGRSHPDSMIGLSNAFLVAGACTVGSTLWKIPDEVTTALMARFYLELKNGCDIDTAMGIAQKAIRDSPKTSSPFYWGAFKIVGSSANPLDPNRSVS